MTAEPRTLTEELNSVLRAGSLDAPPPAATIDRILSEVAEQSPRTFWSHKLVRLRPDHLSAWVGAAAVVLLLVLGGSQLHRLGGDSDKGSASSAAGVALPSAGSSAAGLNQVESSAAAAGAVPGPASGSPNGDAAAASLGCTPFAAPAGQTTVGPEQSRFDIQQAYCSNDASSGSTVRLIASAAGASTFQPTLVTSDQGLELQYVRVEGSTIILRMSATRDLNEHYQGVSVTYQAGAVLDVTFASSDLYAFNPSRLSLVAAPCTSPSITVQAITSPPSTVLSDSAGARIVLQNDSASPCAVSGFPEVHAIFPGYDVIADQLFFGPYGGVTGSPRPPIIVLAPGSKATAILEAGVAPSTHTRSCTSSSTLRITLPNTEDSALEPYVIPLCGLQVHPFTVG
jgi:Protein of unknown function (DUF4232)